MEIPFPFRLLVLLPFILVSTSSVAAQSTEFKRFLDSANAPETSGLSLSPPLVGYDGKIYACCRKNLFALEGNGAVSWIIPLNYSCRMDIAPVGDERGKIFLIAEDRVLKIKPSNVGTSEPVVEIFYGPNSTIGGSGEIIGLSISISSSALFFTVKNRGVFAFMLRGTLLWSAGPVLYRFGYPQGCKGNMTDCYFNSAPVVDQCEGSLYVSNTEGQLYALYTRSPHFRWIQDFSSIEREFVITPGNNAHIYITFPGISLLMALDVSTGNVLWKHNVGPLSRVDCSPVVDSNGWVSIGSLDGLLYSVSPNGDLKKFLKASALDSVIQFSPILDCSGFAVYVTQTSMEAKTSHVIGDYTFVSAMKPTKVVFVLFSPATGTIYWAGKFPGELLAKSDLSYFHPEERILLALLASGRLNIPWPCYAARQKLSWTCSQANPEYVSAYTANERAILLFLLFQSAIIVLLAGSVRFCWIFWRKKKLREKDLGKFLEKRHSLHLRKKEFNRMISELEEKVTEESVANEVMEQLEGIIKAKEGIEKKLSTTYSLGRDGIGSRSNSLLPVYDGKTKSYSFRSGKKESVTIFNTLSDTSTSTERSDQDSSESEGDFSGSNSTSSGRGQHWYSCRDKESSFKGKAPIEGGRSSGDRKFQEEYLEGAMGPVSEFNVLANPLFAKDSVDGTSKSSLQSEEEPGAEQMKQEMGKSISWLKRRTLSSTN
uniref:Protein GAMETE EXPRESSED 3 n=1 Tax=Anthurium amnicola TaxID=1678845 RepID=A0A1D1Y798_9ARAE